MSQFENSVARKWQPPRVTLQLGAPFQLRPVPVGQIGAGFVTALQKFQQGEAGRSLHTNLVVHKEVFLHLRVIKRLAGTDGGLRITGRLRGGIGVECGSLDAPATRPKPRTDDFMGIGYASDAVQSLPRR